MRSAKGTLYRNNDYIRTAPAQSDKAEKPKDPELIRKINFNKEVCLTCTKKKCNGDRECFLERRNRIKKERENDAGEL